MIIVYRSFTRGVMMVDAPALRLSLLGTVRIHDGNRSEDNFRSPRAVALLLYLASQPVAVPRAELVELIWPDLPAERGRANLRWALSYLRKLLPDCWDVSRQTACFVLHAGIQVDTLALKAALELGDVEALAEAVAGAGGEFGRGFYLDEAPEFETWLLARREHWRRQLSRARQRLIDHYSGLGQYDQALVYARQLLAMDNWQEAAQRQVMLLLARNGEFNAALAQFEQCRRLLAEELDVAPQAETMQLYERIRARRAQAPPALPQPATRLVGRETEAAALVQLLLREEERLVTLLGLGGVGKTRLALALAERLQGAFLEGVFFVPCLGITSRDAFLTRLAAALGLSLQGKADVTAALIAHLQTKQVLLVLDNFEQLAPVATVLTPLLAETHGLKLLVTSRERLHLRGERVWRLKGLPYAGGQTAVGTPAGQLFHQVAVTIRPDLATGVAEQAAIQQICTLVEGLPLAIELAAAWSDVLAPTALAAELAGSWTLFKEERAQMPAHQSTLWGTFHYSWRRLTSDEQLLFSRLAVFQGPFSLAAARAVAGGSLPLLARLVDKSLLQFSGEQYQLHELLRQFAAEKLAAQPGEATQLGEAHATYFLLWLAGQHDALKTKRQEVVATEVAARWGNVRAAWEWAVTAGQSELLLTALGALYEYVTLRDRFHEGLALVELLLPLCETPLAQAEAAVYQEALRSYAGQVPDTATLRTRHDPILAEAGADYLWAISHTVNAKTLAVPEIVGALQQALARFTELGDDYYQARTLG
ncbi:MAG: AAA family ATPase, partial [Anaerolineales bacterium]|nr:AAA family ATPase [Anaerolineales bacterium]